MKTAGIVAEYNPFHTGHAYQIARTRGLLGADCAVVAVMSGNWVQRGACAAADKWTRAGWALAGGASSKLGTGGMTSKLQAAALCTPAGCDMVITNGSQPERLYDIAEGKPVGSRFRAVKKG